MNSLASLGLILLIALLAGHVVKFIKVPEVTGYIFAGVLLGPSVLGWISHENVVTLGVFSEVALGLILFSIGSVFDFERVRRVGRAVFRVTLAESVGAATLVFLSMLVLGQPWQVALLLGAIAVETAAASTLMVMRELNAEGPLTETLLGLIGVNNILCLISFYLAASLIQIASSIGEPDLAKAMYAAVFPLPWQLIGSAALGYLIGLVISTWAAKVVEHGETLILLVGAVLLSVGISEIFSLSSLIASLAVGATMVNLSSESRRLFDALSHSDPPFYAIFFVLAGAELNLSLLKTIGVLGAAYILCRATGKFVGARYGARWTVLDPMKRQWVGVAIFSQAGLAVGLTLTINRQFPEFGPAVTTIVLAAVAVFELIGPVSARFAIVRAGERQEQPPATGLLD